MSQPVPPSSPARAHEAPATRAAVDAAEDDSADERESGVIDRPQPPETAENAEPGREATHARRAAPDRKRAARRRRWLGRLLLVVPPLAVLAVDLALRHGRVFTFERPDLVFYAMSAVVGVVLWVSLLGVATRTRGFAKWPVRLLLVVIALLAVGGQVYSFNRYQAYVNHRAVLVGTSFLPSVGQQLWFDRWTFLRSVGPWLVVALVLPSIVTRLAPMRQRWRGWLCLDIAIVAALIGAFVSPERGAEQGQPPDIMYVSAIGQLARAHWDHNETVERVHPGPRSPLPVPALVAKPSRPRNVVMVITESVRAQSVCVEHTPDCKYTPFSNKEVPGRIPLTQMRALDSTTAISLAIMWTGLLPTESRKDLHSAPILWEYTHAANLESAYYTSQNLLFGNSGTWLEGTPWTRHVSATMIEPSATYETGADDGMLVDYALSDIEKLKEPYLAVVHLSNTHFPYKIDPSDMPFTPQDEATGPGYENEILNRYQDSIWMQDKALGRFLKKLHERADASRTVVVYVSDHGEQMREKGAVGHTGTLFEPEIRIPFWIDAPEGTLTREEEASLRALRKTPVTNLDVFPTVMDLLGLWDAPELASFRPKYAGQSLLRGGSSPDRALVFTNCTELWACAFKNWGAVRGTRKLIAHQGDRAWNCFDVADDPDENAPLDLAACADLVPLAEKSMGGHPF